MKRIEFWTLAGGFFVLVIFLLRGFVRRWRIAVDPAGWARRESLRRANEFKGSAMDAARTGNAENFYVFARSALRARFGFPEGLTPVELEAKLLRIPSDLADEIRWFVARSDAAAFAGWRPAKGELVADKKRFQKLFRQIGELEGRFSVFGGRR